MEEQEIHINQQHHRRPIGRFGWGVVLIFIGFIFLAQQFGWLGPNFNWWAIFIFIPAFGSLAEAVNLYQKRGRFDMAVRSSLGSGLVIQTVALMFLFDLNWTVWWPLMLIMPGFAMLLGGFDFTGSSASSGREVVTMGFWIGLGVMYLGAGFLSHNLHLTANWPWFGLGRWWAVAILVPAAGALINALVLAIRIGRVNAAVIGLLIFALCAATVGLVALLGLSWNLLGPVLLILVGIAVLFGVFSR